MLQFDKSLFVLLQNMNYVIKHIPTNALKFGPTYNTNFIEHLVSSIKDEGFAPYLNIPRCNYQGKITKCLYLLEIEHDNLD